MKNLTRIVCFALVATLFAIQASAQCANGNCSSQNATLGESISQLPPQVFAAPAPAPQIAYFANPGSSASSSASTSVSVPQTGQLVVAGYTAPQQQQVAFMTVPVNQVGFQQGGGASSSASAGSASSAASTSTAPALIGASTQLACQNGGCNGGGRFRPFQGFRARRGGSFSKSVSISRS